MIADRRTLEIAYFPAVPPTQHLAGDRAQAIDGLGRGTVAVLALS
jgi:hypothetical protein